MVSANNPPRQAEFIKVLMLGEIYGRAGRQAVKSYLPRLRQQHQPDVVVANGESAAGGFGLTATVIEELLKNGIDVITSGSRIFDQREMVDWLKDNPAAPVLRPLNYPIGVPGQASFICQTAKGAIEVLNLNGKVYFNEMDSPFRAITHWFEKRDSAKVLPLVIDFHAEATSEKVVLGWYLDGQVSAVLGTHTRTPTADARLLHRGTAHVSDVGMVGPGNTVAGLEVETALKPFTSHIALRPKTNRKVTGPLVWNSVLVEIEPGSGRAVSINRIDLTLEDE